jgi:hypothetical protein
MPAGTGSGLREPERRRFFHMPALWVALGIMGIVDAIWSGAVGLTISGYDPFLLIVGGLLCLTVLLRVIWGNPKLAVLAEVWALWMVFASVGNILTYLAATPALPLRDELFARLDRATGFQWKAVFDLIESHALVGRLLSISYGSLIPEILVLAAFLSFAGLEKRIRDFYWIVYIALVLTSVLSSLLPAAGAFPHYGMLDRASWMHDFEALRSRSNLHFSLPDMTGIVTFPSFHAVLPLLVIYVTRGTGAAGYGFAAWNLIMLLSITAIGGHYFVDIAGGAAVFGIALAARRWVAHSQLAGSPVLGGACLSAAEQRFERV